MDTRILKPNQSDYEPIWFMLNFLFSYMDIRLLVVSCNQTERIMPQDKFQNSTDSLISPAKTCFDILPDDATDVLQVTKAIYVGEGGDVTLRSVDGPADVTFANVPSGAVLDVRVKAVRATGTSAADIVGLA